jgi:hypothetical protein
MTAAGQAFSTFEGATPRYMELRSLGGETSLDAYQSVAVEAFDPSPLLGELPDEVPPLTQAATVHQITESRMFASVGTAVGARPALIIRGKFMDADSGGSALRAVGFSPNPFLTAQIEVVDAGSGRVLGVAMVSGTVKSIARTGHGELADGVGKAIRGLLAHHHRKPPKE